MPTRRRGPTASERADVTEPPPVRGLFPELPVVPQLIGMAHLQAKARFADLLVGTPIASMTQWSVLARIRREPGATGAAIARDLRVTPQAVQPMLSQLEAKGLVRRTPAGKSMRAHLTSAGTQALAKADHAVTQYNALVLGSMSTPRFAELEALLLAYVRAVADESAL